MEELNLNETQRQSYEALKTRLKAHLEDGKAKRTAWVGELRTELNKEKPDIQVLAAHVKKATKAFPEAMDRHLDLFVEFYSILDEEQKMKVVQRFRDRIGGFIVTIPSQPSPLTREGREGRLFHICLGRGGGHEKKRMGSIPGVTQVRSYWGSVSGRLGRGFLLPAESTFLSSYVPLSARLIVLGIALVAGSGSLQDNPPRRLP